MDIIKFKTAQDRSLEELRHCILDTPNILNIGMSVQFIMYGFDNEESHQIECKRIRAILNDILSTNEGAKELQQALTDGIQHATIIRPVNDDITPVAMCQGTVKTPNKHYSITILFIGQIYFIKSLEEIEEN